MSDTIRDNEWMWALVQRIILIGIAFIVFVLMVIK
jgi:hypothetical protein